MNRELTIKADEIVSKKDISDASFGKVVMALGVGALLSDKLRKAAKYLIIGGALIQLPVALRITQKAFKFAKQVKQMKEEKGEPAQDLPTEEKEPEVEASATTAEPVADAEIAPSEEEVQTTPDLEHLNHPLEPASHPHEDPTN